jgi:hypothetical protein
MKRNIEKQCHELTVLVFSMLFKLISSSAMVTRKWLDPPGRHSVELWLPRLSHLRNGIVQSSTRPIVYCTSMVTGLDPGRWLAVQEPWIMDLERHQTSYSVPQVLSLTNTDKCTEHSVLNQFKFGMMIVDMSAVKLPGEVKQNNMPRVDADGICAHEYEVVLK